MNMIKIIQKTLQLSILCAIPLLKTSSEAIPVLPSQILFSSDSTPQYQLPTMQDGIPLDNVQFKRITIAEAKTQNSIDPKYYTTHDGKDCVSPAPSDRIIIFSYPLSDRLKFRAKCCPNLSDEEFKDLW